MSTQQPTQAPVEHYVVQPQAYNAVVQTLAQLPYQEVAGVIQLLQAQTRAVHREQPPPPAGKVDRSGRKNPKRVPAAKANGAKPLKANQKEA